MHGRDAVLTRRARASRCERFPASHSAAATATDARNAARGRSIAIFVFWPSSGVWGQHIFFWRFGILGWMVRTKVAAYELDLLNFDSFLMLRSCYCYYPSNNGWKPCDP